MAALRELYDTFIRRRPSAELERLQKATKRVEIASNKIEDAAKRAEESAGVLIRVAADLRGEKRRKTRK